MAGFIHDLQHYQFLQYAVFAALLSAIPAGIIGSLVVVRRTTYIAGAISHCVLGGMGLARYLHYAHGIDILTPLAGAAIAAVAAAVAIGWTVLYAKERADSVLSIIWALGMAVGVTFIMITPGYGQDLMSYLFGSILMVSGTDLVLMAIMDVVILLSVGLFYNRLLAISFNEEAALLRGIPVGVYTFLFLILTALTTVLLVQVVGIVLVIALLTIPAATVAPFSRRLQSMMIAAVALSIVESVGGLVISYAPELPVGATIVELAGACFLVSLPLRGILKRKGFFMKGRTHRAVPNRSAASGNVQPSGEPIE